MNITLVLPSRNRPAGLLGVITALDALATGNNKITYAVVLDNDDYVTLEQWDHWKKSGMLPDGVREFIGARNKTVNARVNDAVRACPGDLYSQIVDDCFPLTQHWDSIFAAARELPALCWQERNDPDNATFLIISEKWRQQTGRFYPEYFPFWFADTWLAEVYKLAFGAPIAVIQQLCMGGKRGTTQGMRDVEFWFKFFAYTRSERIAEAQMLAAAYGRPVNIRMSRAQDIALMEKADAWQLTQVQRYETMFKANLGEPTAIYKRCKEVAEEAMRPRLVAA